MYYLFNHRFIEILKQGPEINDLSTMYPIQLCKIDSKKFGNILKWRCGCQLAENNEINNVRYRMVEQELSDKIKSKQVDGR